MSNIDHAMSSNDQTCSHNDYISLPLPPQRLHNPAIQWLIKQPPDVIADVLDATHLVYKSLSTFTKTDLEAAIRAQQQESTIQIQDLNHKIALIHSSKETEIQDALNAQRFKHQQQIDLQNDEINTLRKQLQIHIDSQHSQINTIRAQEQNQTQQTIQAADQRWQQELKRAHAALDHANQRNSTELERARKAEQHALQQLDILRNSMQELTSECLTRSDACAKKVTDSIAKLTSTHTKGIVGENIAMSVFAELDMGILDDTRYDTNSGCEDYFWKLKLPDVPELRCSVEIKNSAALHSQHDINKHLTRVQEAARTAKINAALFCSLRCKIPNTRAISIKRVAGIPVLYISGLDLTPVQVVEVGFRVMAQLWSNSSALWSDAPTTTNNDSGLAESALEHITKQLDGLVHIHKHILDIENHANAQLKTAGKLYKLRQEMLAGITNFQNTNNLWPDGASDTPDYEHLEKAVINYYDDHNRYPKSEAQLGLKLPHGVTLEELTQRVKATKRLANKRQKTDITDNA